MNEQLANDPITRPLTEDDRWRILQMIYERHDDRLHPKAIHEQFVTCVHLLGLTFPEGEEPVFAQPASIQIELDRREITFYASGFGTFRLNQKTIEEIENLLHYLKDLNASIGSISLGETSSHEESPSSDRTG